MAGNLKTTYDATNFVLTQDYSYRFNQIDVGKPEVVAEYDPETDEIDVKTVAWKRAVMEESAGFKYIGMDYTTAQSCVNSMKSALTFSTDEWQYGWHKNQGNFEYGWYKKSSTPTIESEIRLEQRSGCMYDVVVNAKCVSVNYSKQSRATDTGSRPLYTNLQYLSGWTSQIPLDGKHFDAASAENISLIVAPTQTVKFELVGQNIVTTDQRAESGLSFDDWYRATTDQYAQVKYEGMTKAACRSLFSTLNGTNGWWLSYHPWVYGANQDNQTGEWTIGWHLDSNTTVYQCLNDFKATEDESGMFTAEVSLHAQQVEMTTSPRNYTAPAYPALWSTKIPGLYKYL